MGVIMLIDSRDAWSTRQPVAPRRTPPPRVAQPFPAQGRLQVAGERVTRSGRDKGSVGRLWPTTYPVPAGPRGTSGANGRPPSWSPVGVYASGNATVVPASRAERERIGKANRLAAAAKRERLRYASMRAIDAIVAQHRDDPADRAVPLKDGRVWAPVERPRAQNRTKSAAAAAKAPVVQYQVRGETTRIAELVARANRAGVSYDESDT